MTQYIATYEVNTDNLWVALDADSIEDARDEAVRVFAAGEAPGAPENPHDLWWVQIVRVTDAESVDLEAILALHDTRRARWAASSEAWERAAEELRDEVGHRRTLLRRGDCPRAHVAVAEDRLKAHLNAKP